MVIKADKTTLICLLFYFLVKLCNLNFDVTCAKNDINLAR